MAASKEASQTSPDPPPRQTKSLSDSSKNDDKDSSPPPSSSSSSSDLQAQASPSEADPEKEAVLSNRGQSLNDRGRIPASAYVTFGSILLLQCYSGIWEIETVESWCDSMRKSSETTLDFIGYTGSLSKTLWEGDYRPWAEYARAGLIFLAAFSCIYVFFLAPLMAGFWTGPRTRKFVFHRYMGLFYLLQYFLAWVEYLTDYEKAKFSFLPHSIALTGILQATSAYFTFKVLPHSSDAGYYSDKAVLSRTFIHENIFFTLMTVFGSLYYVEPLRAALQSNLVGRALEYLFVFFPFAIVRRFYPITRFKNAGTTKKGRTAPNHRFYEIGTLMVKIFFLYAKYFLGYFIAFIIFLDLVTEENWRFLHGLMLLNIGTVSLAMFLHTLRFRKVLPPRFTFSIYLLQIYATFSAIPFAYELFIPHPKLCGLCFVGLLCNMTRSRRMHAAWCVVAALLLSRKGIEW